MRVYEWGKGIFSSFPGIYQRAAPDLQSNLRAEMQRGKKMNGRKIIANEFLLNLVSHKAVAWTLVKLGTVYKYVGLFV